MYAMHATFAIFHACRAPNNEIKCNQLERSPSFDKFWSQTSHFRAVKFLTFTFHSLFTLPDVSAGARGAATSKSMAFRLLVNF